jgi:hypothetical protein
VKSEERKTYRCRFCLAKLKSQTCDYCKPTAQRAIDLLNTASQFVAMRGSVLDPDLWQAFMTGSVKV